KAVFARVLEPVEAARLVRAIVCAVAGAHAAIVDLLVETLIAVDCGERGANGLARSVLALLAHHGLVCDFDLFGRAGVVTVDADPVLFGARAASAAADSGRIVPHLAGQHARGTSGTRV